MELELRFGDFGWEEILAAAGTPAQAGALVADACSAYDRRRREPVHSLKPPPLRPERGPARTVHVRASSRLWRQLLMDALRQGTSLERLVEHAVVLYLAGEPQTPTVTGADSSSRRLT